MPTLRCEFHRFRAGASTLPRHEVGSSVWQVFEGSGTVVLGGQEHKVSTGDLVVVPSWVPWSLHADTPFDLFRFNDGPIIDRLRFTRTHVPDRPRQPVG
jgi:gentisate 1,2-dioxygenase